MTALIQANAIAIPLADNSVDLAISSPPYFALRSYRDSGEHYENQIGSEPSPKDFLVALWTVMDELHRVLKPTGSCWINLGDKHGGSGGHNNAMGSGGPLSLSGGRKKLQKQADAAHEHRSTRRNAPDRYNQASDVRTKSLMGLPWRFVLGLICPDPYRICYEDGDHPQWVLRATVIQHKKNHLPESVQDRVARAHEDWFHLVKEPRYFAAVDEIREEHVYGVGHGEQSGNYSNGSGRNDHGRHASGGFTTANALGKLPGSVWSLASEPLTTPDFMVLSHASDMNPTFLKDETAAWKWVRWSGVCSSPWPRPTGETEGPFLVEAPDHFAAFGQTIVSKIVRGWSPSGICEACGEPRRPVVEKNLVVRNRNVAPRKYSTGLDADAMGNWSAATEFQGSTEVVITGTACACPDTSAPTRPAIVLDPFSGTGTVCGVAKALGRFGVGIDLSADYLRLARWRVEESGAFAKTVAKTNLERQGQLFGGAA